MVVETVILVRNDGMRPERKGVQDNPRVAVQNQMIIFAHVKLPVVQEANEFRPTLP